MYEDIYYTGNTYNEVPTGEDHPLALELGDSKGYSTASKMGFKMMASVYTTTRVYFIFPLLYKLCN